MLLLDSARTVTVDGVTVMPDHAVKNQFWYLPAPVALARRGSPPRPQFTLILYRRARPTPDGEDGHGFLMFEVDLAVPDETLQRIRDAVRPFSDGEPMLTPAPFSDGTVRCMALDLEGPGGTAKPGDHPGTFHFTETIRGARKPSLAGNNSAAFSLDLTQDGAVVMRDAFTNLTAPVGVLYELTYSGLRPALDVTLTADFERIYNHFAASIEGRYAWLQGSIEAALDFLQQDGAITIQVHSFSDAADRDEKEKWVKEFFAKDLQKQWFEPTMLPVSVTDGSAGITVPSVDQIKQAVTGGGPAATPGNAHQPARLAVTTSTPAQLPQGLEVRHAPATKGTTETVTVTQGATVTVDGKPVTVAPDGTCAVEVAEGQTRTLAIDWPAQEPTSETFTLRFGYGRPAAADFTTAPPSPAYRAYLDGTTDDADFTASAGPGGRTGPKGVAEWVAALPAPRSVDIQTQARHEGSGGGTADDNQRLAERRLQVAKGLVGDRATVSRAQAVGTAPDTPAEAQPDPDERYARITGTGGTARPAASVTATLSRPKRTAGNNGAGQGATANGGTGADPVGPAGATPVSLAFKLKFVHKEERKKVTIRYNRQEAVQRGYNVQGFFGLMAQDLADPGKHILEVDGDDPFFREITVTAAAPFDMKALGIAAADLAIDYGEPGGQSHKHEEIRFTPDRTGERTATFHMNAAGTTDYRQSVQYHFATDGEWDGDDTSLQVGPVSTDDRTLLLNPFEHLEFFEVSVEPGRIDDEVVRAIDVTFEVDSGARPIRRTFTVRPGASAQRWKVRSATPGSREYRYSTVAHLADGTTRSAGPVTSAAPICLVDDPFTDGLDIEFVESLDPDVRTAIVDIEYRDPANGYRRTERRTAAPGATVPPLRIALMDPAQREFSYRLTVIGPNGGVRRDPFIPTTDTLLVIQ